MARVSMIDRVLGRFLGLLERCSKTTVRLGSPPSPTQTSAKSKTRNADSNSPSAVGTMGGVVDENVALLERLEFYGDAGIAEVPWFTSSRFHASTLPRQRRRRLPRPRSCLATRFKAEWRQHGNCLEENLAVATLLKSLIGSWFPISSVLDS